MRRSRRPSALQRLLCHCGSFWACYFFLASGGSREISKGCVFELIKDENGTNLSVLSRIVQVQVKGSICAIFIWSSQNLCTRNRCLEVTVSVLRKLGQFSSRCGLAVAEMGASCPKGRNSPATRASSWHHPPRARLRISPTGSRHCPALEAGPGKFRSFWPSPSSGGRPSPSQRPRFQ